MVIRGVLVAATLVALSSSPALAQVDQILRGLPNIPSGGAPSGIGEVKIGEGLKEALKVGTENAVITTGRRDGYFLNQAIKILMPDKLRTLEKGLRAVGYGPQVDEFVLGMNRAAEQAAPAAKAIFWDAIGAITIDDARGILAGGDTAATEYFKSKTTNRLSDAFRPVVERAMNEVGATRQYKELLAQAQMVPFLRTDAYDVDRYVVGKALDGLFRVVGDEERKIRQNPSARVSSLLKEVFGSRGQR